MLNSLLILIGKILSKLSSTLNLGSGSTWPGHIALSINKNFINDIIKKNNNLKIVLIAGTNGKTTTSKMIRTILEKDGNRVFQNESGANLLNGIASSMLLRSSILCVLNYDYAIFEVDENVLPLILNELSPSLRAKRSNLPESHSGLSRISPLTIILLDLFRDQLDRYGEVDTIARKWKEALSRLCHSREGDPSKKVVPLWCGNPILNLILNADDPQIAFLGVSLQRGTNFFARTASELRVPEKIGSEQKNNINVSFFGLNDKKLGKPKSEHAADTIYCPNCGEKLNFELVYFSHIGIWKCNKCKLERPKPNLDESPIYPLSGIYNRYNTLAAILFAKNNNVNNLTIQQSLEQFSPAFGRQELLDIGDKKIHLFLSKNPTSFNESLRTIIELGGKNILFVLNDRIPDGRDVSWIWDTEIEELDDNSNVIVSGDRAYDMALRLKYASSSQIKNGKLKIKNSFQISNLKFQIEEDLRKAIQFGLEKTGKSETLYILPTYSAMLEVRKILTGKKIL